MWRGPARGGATRTALAVYNGSVCARRGHHSPLATGQASAVRWRPECRLPGIMASSRVWPLVSDCKLSRHVVKNVTRGRMVRRASRDMERSGWQREAPMCPTRRNSSEPLCRTRYISEAAGHRRLQQAHGDQLACPWAVRGGRDDERSTWVSPVRRHTRRHTRRNTCHHTRRHTRRHTYRHTCCHPRCHTRRRHFRRHVGSHRQRDGGGGLGQRRGGVLRIGGADGGRRTKRAEGRPRRAAGAPRAAC